MKKFLVLLTILVIGGGVFSSHAQDNSGSSIYFNMQGDIWSYTPSTGELTQLSTWGYNENPIMSPDGTRFAYLSLAQIGADVIAQRGEVYDPRPMNIWVWEINVGDAYRLVDQPANATFNGEYLENVIRRTSLAWSPDGTQLGWIELNSSPDTTGFELVIYNFTTQTFRVLTTDLPYPYADAGFIGYHVMSWGEGGLAVDVIGVNDEGTDIVDSLSVYDPITGSLLSREIIRSDDPGFLRDFFWVSPTQIALIFESIPPQIYSIQDGSRGPVTTLALQGSGSVITEINLGKTLADSQQAWEVLWTGGQPITVITSRITDQISFSPSGDTFAFVNDALYVWSGGGEPQKISGTEGITNTYPRGLVWGGSQWEARIICTLTPRLAVNGQGAVITGLGDNILRDSPGRNLDGSLEIGQIPPGGLFTVLAGPECVSGYQWWLVDYSGQVGWTAEGEGSTYWLEPR